MRTALEVCLGVHALVCVFFAAIYTADLGEFKIKNKDGKARMKTYLLVSLAIRLCAVVQVATTNVGLDTGRAANLSLRQDMVVQRCSTIDSLHREAKCIGRCTTCRALCTRTCRQPWCREACTRSHKGRCQSRVKSRTRACCTASCPGTGRSSTLAN